jgi:very-short-patch-repair endonuclease
MDDEIGPERWRISPSLRRKMRDSARALRRDPTPTERILWQAIRYKQLDGRRFRRQVPIGPFVVDFYCPAERLAVEVDGAVHESQREADALRQSLIESLGIRFVRIPAQQVATDLPSALEAIRAAFDTPPG